MIQAIFFSLVAFGALGFPSESRAADPGPLDGTWEGIAFACEGGQLDAVTKSALGDATREPKPRMEIRGESVKMSTPDRRSKAGFCEVITEDSWRLTETTYTVLSSKVSQQLEHGAQCSPENKTSVTGVAHRYERNGDTLRLYLDFPKNTNAKAKPVHGKAICEGGTLVAIYQKTATQ